MRLLSSGVFEAAYPLHDGSYDSEGPEGEDGSTRRVKQCPGLFLGLYLIPETYKAP